MVHFIPCSKTLDAVHVAKFFFKEIVKLHALPRLLFVIRMQSLSYFQRSLWKKLNIKLSFLVLFTLKLMAKQKLLTKVWVIYFVAKVANMLLSGSKFFQWLTWHTTVLSTDLQVAAPLRSWLPCFLGSLLIKPMEAWSSVQVDAFGKHIHGIHDDVWGKLLLVMRITRHMLIWKGSLLILTQEYGFKNRTGSASPTVGRSRFWSGPVN